MNPFVQLSYANKKANKSMNHINTKKNEWQACKIWGLFGGNQWWEGEWKERVRGGEYDQSTSYAIMKVE
jgi:hypothetical protein